MSETRLANRLANAERRLPSLEEAVAEPLDEKLMNLDATVHRFNTTFESLLEAVGQWPGVVQRPCHEGVAVPASPGFRRVEGGPDRGRGGMGALLNAQNATVHEYSLEKALALYRDPKVHTPRPRRLLDRMNADQGQAR